MSDDGVLQLILWLVQLVKMVLWNQLTDVKQLVSAGLQVRHFVVVF